MKTFLWITTGLLATAMIWNMGPDLRRYIKMHAM